MDDFKYNIMKSLIKDPTSTVTMEQYEVFCKELFGKDVKLARLLYAHIANSQLPRTTSVKSYMHTMSESSW